MTPIVIPTGVPWEGLSDVSYETLASVTVVAGGRAIRTGAGVITTVLGAGVLASPIGAGVTWGRDQASPTSTAIPRVG